MQLVRLTRQPRVQLQRRVRLRQPPTHKQHRQRVRLRLLLTNKQRPPLRPVRHRRLHLLAHPVRARNRPLALLRPGHRLANKMNFEPMKPNLLRRSSNLVGRGSRSTDDCVQSPRRFDLRDSIRTMNPPSRRSKMCHLSGRESNLQTAFKFSSRWARLGEPVGPTHDQASINGRPCDYQSAIREPRPTKFGPRPTNGPAAFHLSPFTFYLRVYACS